MLIDNDCYLLDDTNCYLIAYLILIANDTNLLFNYCLIVI